MKKVPIAEFLCSPSMLVVHTPAENAALAQLQKDYGLKPNGLTIEEMREFPEFYRPLDDLDRLSVAVKLSGDLKTHVLNSYNRLRNVTTDRNRSFV